MADENKTVTLAGRFTEEECAAFDAIKQAMSDKSGIRATRALVVAACARQGMAEVGAQFGVTVAPSRETRPWGVRGDQKQRAAKKGAKR